ncbi:unnamed protein product [Camellia sinensis]
MGLSVVNALSEALEVIVWRDGKEYQQKYSRGKPVTTLICHELPDESKDRQGTHIKFWPDKEVFTTAIQFDYPTIAGRIRELAFLNPEVESLQPACSSIASLKLLNIDFSMSLEFFIFSF